VWQGSTVGVAYGGTGVTASTGTTSVVLSASPTFTGVPAAPTAANGTNTTQLATAAFAYGAVSKTASGYTKLPNGLIMQWGLSAVAGTNAYVTVTLPIAYTTAHFNCVTTILGAVGYPDLDALVYSTNLTTATLGHNGSGGNFQIYWQSTGY
jgi:hypothetical protein